MMYDVTWYPRHYEMWNTPWQMGPWGFVGLSVLGFLFFAIVIAALALKGFALWHAAKRNEKWWFIALLVINTMGLLELVYLIFVAKVLFRGKCCHKGTCEVPPEPQG